MYEIVIERSSQKALGKIPPPYFNRIIKAINNFPLTQDQKDIKNLPEDLVSESGLAITELFMK